MKTNRLFITVMMAAIFSCGNMLAQNAQAPNQKKKLTPEQRQEMQINRMQKSLMLDDETAAKFAPLYKEYLEALKACRTEMKHRRSLNSAKLNGQTLKSKSNWKNGWPNRRKW